MTIDERLVATMSSVTWLVLRERSVKEIRGHVCVGLLANSEIEQ